MAEMKTYIAPNAPFMKLRLMSIGKVQFEKGVLQLQDTAAIEEMDKLIQTRSDISQKIQSVEDAEAVFQQRLEHQQNQPFASVASGPVNSEQMRQARKAHLEARDANLQAQLEDPDALKKIRDEVDKDSGMMLTANASNEVHRDSGEGFKPMAKQEQEAAPEQSKTSFGKKGK